MKSESETISPRAKNTLHEVMAALSPEMTVDEVAEMLEMTEKGRQRTA